MEAKKGLKEFKEALSKDEALRKEYETECKKVAEANEAANDAEVIAKAAGKLCYELSMAEVEREMADKEALSNDELEKVSGGYIDPYEEDDEYGHSLWCLFAWHCYTASIHTQTKNKLAACYSDYGCIYKNKKDY